MKLNTLIQYEYLTGKSFFSIANADEGEVATLVYCYAYFDHKHNDIIPEFTQFLDQLGRGNLNDKVERFNKAFSLIAQFNNKPIQFKSVPERTTTNEQGEEQKILFVSDIVYYLISKGVDADWLYYSLEFHELAFFAKAFEDNQEAEKMEKRLLTYYLCTSPGGLQTKEYTNTIANLLGFKFDSQSQEPNELTGASFEEIGCSADDLGAILSNSLKENEQ